MTRSDWSTAAHWHNIDSQSQSARPAGLHSTKPSRCCSSRWHPHERSVCVASSANGTCCLYPLFEGPRVQTLVVFPQSFCPHPFFWRIWRTRSLQLPAATAARPSPVSIRFHAQLQEKRETYIHLRGFQRFQSVPLEKYPLATISIVYTVVSQPLQENKQPRSDNFADLLVLCHESQETLSWDREVTHYIPLPQLVLIPMSCRWKGPTAECVLIYRTFAAYTCMLFLPPFVPKD